MMIEMTFVFPKADLSRYESCSVYSIENQRFISKIGIYAYIQNEQNLISFVQLAHL